MTIRITDAQRTEPASAEPTPPADEAIDAAVDAVDPWSRPETMPSRSANLVMLWLLIPFVAVILYGLLVR